MDIVGINMGHDSSVALLRDRRIIAAAEEERFLDIKHYAGPPLKSLDYILSVADTDELKLIAVNGLLLYGFLGRKRLFPQSEERGAPVSTVSSVARRVHSIPFLRTLLRIGVKLTGKPSFRDVTLLEKELAKRDVEVVLVEHHHSHAASAYYSAPWFKDNTETLILTLDMAGDGLFATVSVGRDRRIQRLASSPVSASIGTLYSAATNYLGLNMLEDEFKVMGLAAYGDPGRSYDIFSRLVKLSDKEPLRFEHRGIAFGKTLLSKHQPDQYLFETFSGLRGKRRSARRFDNIAAGLQAFTEEIIVKWVENAIERTRIRKLALAGGVFLNVKLNKRLLEHEAVEDLFVFPASSDGGGAIGAAYEGYHYLCDREGRQFDPEPVKELYLGPEFPEEEIKAALKEFDLGTRVERYSDVELMIAEWVSKGQVVGRFHSRMEFGPRALGNRSILARADDINMIKHVNTKVKQRTWWMPFAPTILDYRSKDYLVNPRAAPYMTLLFDTTSKRGDIVAATHPFDGTCRPQVLEEPWNPEYFRVIRKYEELTGFGGLLNTSFNLHGHTMVCTPRQAIWTFLNSGLDILVLSDYVLRKR